MTFLQMDDGAEIYFEDTGKGETLIFAHGLNSSHKANKDFYDCFKDKYRVILYDQRGHGDSEKTRFHMNVKRLGQDLNEIIESLKLSNVTVIGHSMGAATIYSYINQFGCDKLKRIVASDMSPYMRNNGWKGGIGQGMWSDEDFMCDLERIFDNVGNAAFYISKNLMDTNLLNVSEDEEKEIINQYGKSTDTLTMASLWFSLFRSDQRPQLIKSQFHFYI